MISKILIVEDNRIERLRLCRILTSLGYHYHEASTAQEAIELSKLHKFALALIDIQLPDMDGKELLQKINIDKIIMMTATKKDPKSVLESVNLGALDFLVKPITTQVLNQKLKQSLRRVA